MSLCARASRTLAFALDANAVTSISLPVKASFCPAVNFGDYTLRDLPVPQLIPPVTDYSSIKNDGEREVIEQLMVQLPAQARIYHNFDLLTAEYRNGGGAGIQLKEGEIDAIVLLPDRSIVIVEVKGRGLRYQSDINQWQRNNNGRWLSENSPFEQAKRNTHRLMDCLKLSLGAAAVESIRFGYMVVFPFSEIRGPSAHEMQPAIYCDATGMGQLGKQLMRVPEKMSPKVKSARSVGNSPLLLKEIHTAILPEMQLVPSLRVAVDSDVKVLLRLTRDQSHILDTLSRRKRALIEGVAGSGKSVLAIEQARRFAARGNKVLLLCYNSALAGWIGKGIADEMLENPVSGSVEVRTFHDFCARSCIEANIEFAPGEDQDGFWRNVAPDLLLDCEQVQKEFDAIIVDEGQDFHALWCTPIEECLKEDGTLFVFCDPEQDIFNANGLSELNMGDDIYPLLKNCRNTKKIARFCDGVVNINTDSHEDAPDGRDVVFTTITNEDKRIDHVRELLNQWVLDEGISPSRIAVLSPNKPAKTCLKDGISPSKVSLTNDASQWRDGTHVLHTTVRGFKGLDAEFVILLDLPEPGTHRVFGLTDYYVGASRAIWMLHVVAKERWSGGLADAA